MLGRQCQEPQKVECSQDRAYKGYVSNPTPTIFFRLKILFQLISQHSLKNDVHIQKHVDDI